MRLTLIILLRAMSGLAAEDPTPKNEVLYFPVKEGVKWVREVKVGEKAFELTETITKVATKDGKHTVTLESVADNGQGKPRTSVFEVSEKGLLRISDREAEGEPLPLLKLGLKEGESWTADQAGPGGEVGKANYTMGKTEKVTVPAGTYTAIRVEVEIKFKMRITRMTFWYAPGIGSVKFESVAGERKQTTTLKSFTPAK